MTKLVTITITGKTDAAVNATAKRIVNTMDNVSKWVDANHHGLIDNIIAQTREVTIVETKSAFAADVNGDLIVK